MTSENKSSIQGELLVPTPEEWKTIYRISDEILDTVLSPEEKSAAIKSAIIEFQPRKRLGQIISAVRHGVSPQTMDEFNRQRATVQVAWMPSVSGGIQEDLAGKILEEVDSKFRENNLPIGYQYPQDPKLFFQET